MVGSSLEPKEKKLIRSPTKSQTLKAAIFHTMTFTLSLETNQNKISHFTRRSFLKVLYNVSQFGQKGIPFEPYYRIHVKGPQIAVFETISDTVFVLNSQFTQKDPYFHAAFPEAMDALDNVLKDFGYHQKIENYKSQIDPIEFKHKHPFYKN